MSLLVDIKKRLKGFSIDVAFETEGDYLGILGASGSGKSLTLKCIAGVETPDEGRIIINGKTLFDSAKKINLKPQDRNIGYLFQNYALFPHLTVEENIGIGLDISDEEKQQKVAGIIKIFRLTGLEKKYPNQISGGQQQRAALARAIIYKPDILMLDEPFTALDTYLKELLQNRVLELLKLYNGEVLMVTHSRDEIYRFCKRLVILDRGRSILSGDTKEIFKQPKLLTVGRLTGCKNISKCKVLSPHHIYAVDWDITLETEEIVSERTKYLGIRAHDLKIIDDSGEKDYKNIINCRINRIVEDFFEYNIFLENNEIKKNEGNGEILYKIGKEKWDNRKVKENLRIKIPKDSILLLE
jgi:molybdate transport system ATP-binding protein